MTLLYLPKAGPTAKIIENMTWSHLPQGWSHSQNNENMNEWLCKSENEMTKHAIKTKNSNKITYDT